MFQTFESYEHDMKPVSITKQFEVF